MDVRGGDVYMSRSFGRRTKPSVSWSITQLFGSSLLSIDRFGASGEGEGRPMMHSKALKARQTGIGYHAAKFVYRTIVQNTYKVILRRGVRTL